MLLWIVLVTHNGTPWEVVGVFKHMPLAKRLRAKVNRQLRGIDRFSVCVVGSTSYCENDLE